VGERERFLPIRRRLEGVGDQSRLVDQLLVFDLLGGIADEVLDLAVFVVAV
jgi:hypothetical protein